MRYSMFGVWFLLASFFSATNNREISEQQFEPRKRKGGSFSVSILDNEKLAKGEEEKKALTNDIDDLEHTIDNSIFDFETDISSIESLCTILIKALEGINSCDDPGVETNTRKLKTLIKLKQIFKMCDDLLIRRCNDFNDLLFDLRLLYNRKSKIMKLEPAFLLNDFFIGTEYRFRSGVENLLEMKRTCINGSIRQAINKDFIKKSISSGILSIVEIVGIKGLRIIYELEDLRDRLNKISKGDLPICTGSRTIRSRFTMKVRENYLENRLKDMKENMSAIFRVKLDYLIEIRRIFEQLLEEDDKSDTMQERSASNQKERIIFPNDIIKGENKRYEIRCIIGDGLSGIIYECEDLDTKEIHAIKILHKDGIKELLKSKEFTISGRLSRLGVEKKKYLLLPIDSFISNELYFMVFEMFEMDLYDYILKTSKRGLLTKDVIKSIMKQIFQGLSALKCQNIIHRDIKLENILIDTKTTHLNICDFGLSCIAHSKNQERVGTKCYTAPEVLNGGLYSFPIDMWSAGCIFFELIVDTHLFSDKGLNKYLDECSKESKGNLNTPFLNKMKKSLEIIDGAYDFLRAILKENPEERLTPEEALEEIERF
eukprot:GHVP01012920.1.p1 GENE.GHVP01012920.1~~GHVP01012920.1.p1  ORF type:complete len:600 (+),score=92.70 GHVP01012920.1:52-1851(+)